jgi:hypothetical protein
MLLKRRVGVAAERAFSVGVGVAILALIDAFWKRVVGRGERGDVVWPAVGGFVLFFVLTFVLAYVFPPHGDELASAKARWFVWPLLGALTVATFWYALR